MRMGPETAVRRPWKAALSGLALSLLAWSGPRADTLVKLSWDANRESDLAGYRLYYGTASGSYGQRLDVGNATTYDLHGLDSSTTYFFAVVAYDLAGNVSAFSNEISAKPAILVGSLPTIASAIESATSSIYITRSGHHLIRVAGTNFQSGATISLGSDIVPGATSVTGGTQLTVTIDVGAAASLGPRTLTVTNPDGGAGGLATALQVTQTPDINRDCRVDSSDLNVIGRVFGKQSADPGFDPAADLDGSGMIDGPDLLIFTAYFGLPLAVCP